jgi:hypothetical protein
VGALALGAAAALHPGPSLAQDRAEKLAQFLKGELGELKDLKGDVKQEIAYLFGMECYAYGFPLVLMDVTNGVITATSKSAEYKAPINQFGRMRTYVSPNFKDVVPSASTCCGRSPSLISTRSRSSFRTPTPRGATS